jgi:hypothetical protein
MSFLNGSVFLGSPFLLCEVPRTFCCSFIIHHIRGITINLIGTAKLTALAFFFCFAMILAD